MKSSFSAVWSFSAAWRFSAVGEVGPSQKRDEIEFFCGVVIFRRLVRSW